MAKVFIGLDAFYSYFLWSNKVLDLIDPNGDLPLVEVPEDLVEEYDNLAKAIEHMNARLRILQHEKDKV